MEASLSAQAIDIDTKILIRFSNFRMPKLA